VPEQTGPSELSSSLTTGKQIRKAIGHPTALVMTDSLIGMMKAHLTAVNEWTASKVTDEAVIQARDAHLFASAEYVSKQPFLAAASPPGSRQLYSPVTAEGTLNNCCSNLLLAIGLETMYPADVERLRRARSGCADPHPQRSGSRDN
jgi:hypothetical protein